MIWIFNLGASINNLSPNTSNLKHLLYVKCLWKIVVGALLNIDGAGIWLYLHIQELYILKVNII